MSRLTITETLEQWFIGLRKELERSAKHFKVDLRVVDLAWTGLYFESGKKQYSIALDFRDHEIQFQDGKNHLADWSTLTGKQGEIAAEVVARLKGLWKGASLKEYAKKAAIDPEHGYDISETGWKLGLVYLTATQQRLKRGWNSNKAIRTLSVMTGAKNFIQHNENKIQWDSPVPGKKQRYFLEYDAGRDLYNLQIGNIRGMKYTKKHDFKGVYGSDLMKTFEKATKLYLY